MRPLGPIGVQGRIVQRRNQWHEASRFQDRYGYWKSVEGQRDVGAGRAVRMHACFLRRARGLVLPVECDFVSVGVGRVVSEMLSGTARLMRAIGSDHAPAELKSEDRQDEVDKASGGHGEKYSMGHRLAFAPHWGWLVSELSKTVRSYNDAVLLLDENYVDTKDHTALSPPPSPKSSAASYLTYGCAREARSGSWCRQRPVSRFLSGYLPCIQRLADGCTQPTAASTSRPPWSG